MQVNHNEEHVTHAIIGGGTKEAINFGISSDPAFFQILSSSLYKNPMLAMVRETICNAWDAHIASERTDQPIQVWVDEEYFTVKDIGEGIPDDLIGPIYAVYGGSTKKHDGAQTGGFGLGCKSPFAYTDHFEVISCHEGVKTIYRMAKSSGETGGKPSVNTIMSAPTTETGVTVRIPVNSYSDRSTIQNHINTVIYRGGIYAVNNEEIAYGFIDYSKADGSFILLDNNLIDRYVSSGVYVKYGNVIYPVNKSAEFPQFDKLRNVLQSCAQNIAGSYSCILLAPPDSISVAPSREDISMQSNTIATVNKLIDDALNKLIQFTNRSYLRDSLDQQKIAEVASQYKDTPAAVGRECFIIRDLITGVYTTQDEIAHTVAVTHFKTLNEWEEPYINELIKQGAFTRKQFNDIYKHRPATWNGDKSRAGVVRNALIKPVLKKLAKVYPAVGKNIYSTGVLHDGYCTPLLFLQKPLIVLSRKKDLDGDRVRLWAKQTNAYLPTAGVTIIKVNGGATQQACQQILQGRTDIRFLDLTVHNSWEPVPEEKPSVPKERKPRVKALPGYPELAAYSAMTSNGHLTNTLWGIKHAEHTVRVTEPKAYLVFNPNQENRQQYCTSGQVAIFTKYPFNKCTNELIRLFGSGVAVVRTVTQGEKLKQEGILDFFTYVKDQMASLIQDTEVQAFIRDGGLLNNFNDFGVPSSGCWRGTSSFTHPRIISKFLGNESFSKAVGITTPKVPNEKVACIIEIARSLDTSTLNEAMLSVTVNPALKALDKLIDSLPYYRADFLDRVIRDNYDMTNKDCEAFILGVLHLIFLRNLNDSETNNSGDSGDVGHPASDVVQN